MLKGIVLWVMHGSVVIILNTIFLCNVQGPFAAGVTYSTLYFILTYATWVLKYNYDRIHQNLRDTNIELHEKATEIAARNAELLQTKDNLSTLNKDLEKIVNERTAKIQLQNEILVKYSYTNAHHLRGPVARLLGLGAIYKLESKPMLISLSTKWSIKPVKLIP
jgi:signal transduction histidine kinase